jgi:oxysterol-binding protein-related protein 9/10/11
MRSFKGDLSSLTTPAFLLSDKSFIEHPANWASPPSLLTAPASQTDPVARSLAILKWFIISRNGERHGIRKKPLNPFLGERFLASLQEPGGSGSGSGCHATSVVAECVSHHPPIAAFRLRNDTHDVTLEGYSRTKMSFSTSLCFEHVGHTLLRLGKFGEEYLITQPKMYLSGLLPPWRQDFEGKSFIVGSNGIVVEFVFSSKSWYSFGGKDHAFKARAYRRETPEQALYTVEGTWKPESYTVRDGATGKVLETVNVKRDGGVEMVPVQVRPIEEQDPLETRRAWRPVAEAIVKGDYARATAEKSKIEVAQRELRKREVESGVAWKARYFQSGDGEAAEAAEGLLALVGGKLRQEETKGVWRWKGGEGA